MKTMLKVLLLCAFGAPAFAMQPQLLQHTPAQVSATAGQPDVPVLSTAQTVAFQALVEKIQANAKEREALMGVVRQVETEIAKAHPGYHFDEATGAIAKDAVVVVAPDLGKK
jgi:hypothetical protein